MADPIVVMTAEALAELVKAAVLEAIEGSRPASEAPTLLDRAGLARVLGCSLPTVDRLNRDGVPRVMLGDSPRYSLPEVLTWLREREANREAPAHLAGVSTSKTAAKQPKSRSGRSSSSTRESASTAGPSDFAELAQGRANGAGSASRGRDV